MDPPQKQSEQADPPRPSQFWVWVLRWVLLGVFVLGFALLLDASAPYSGDDLRRMRYLDSVTGVPRLDCISDVPLNHDHSFLSGQLAPPIGLIVGGGAAVLAMWHLRRRRRARAT
jgi:hypothetical protein